MNNDEPNENIEDTEKPPQKAERKSAARKPIGWRLASFLLVVFVVIGVIMSPNYVVYDARSICSYTEEDARNVLGALASYFSEPENKRMPELSVLVSHEGLSLNNPAANVSLYPLPGSLVQDYSLSDPGEVVHTIRVRIIDASERCPRNNTYIATMGGGASYWE